jgi:hypothetical protein
LLNYDTPSPAAKPGGKEIPMVDYIVQGYDRYPIYEPAEGGYYYEGLEPEDADGHIRYANLDAAKKALAEIVDEANDGYDKRDEGYMMISRDGLRAFTVNERYIGAGYEYYIEPTSQRGLHRKGWRPYC